MPKVLLVEDNEMNRDMLARYLKWEGFQVAIATNGQQAVDLARTQTANIPVIALTAHAMVEDREKSFAAGCNDYETKPVIFTRLITKMRALIVQEEV